MNLELFLVVSLCCLGHALAGSHILILGDSMGEYACPSGATNRVQQSCAGSTVTNAGVSGSTAWEWRAGGTYSATEAFEAAGASVTHVWLTAGGNDWMMPGEKSTGAPGASSASCAISKADLVSRIQGMVDNVNAAATAKGITGLKILVTGYLLPFTPECGTVAQMTTFTGAYTEIAANNANVVYENIQTASGGSITGGTLTNGQAQYFVGDGLHLNARGYCAAFTLSGVQTALSCTAATYDCATVAAVTCTGAVTTAAGSLAAAPSVLATLALAAFVNALTLAN